MRSQGFMIDSSKFRHNGNFEVYSEGTDNIVRGRTQDSIIPVWFSFFYGSGLNRGFSNEVNLEQQDRWLALDTDNSIVFRFLEELENFFKEKKIIQLVFKNEKYRLTSLLDLNGESVYMVGELQGIK